MSTLHEGEAFAAVSPWGLALARDGKRLYVANGLSNDLSVIDTATLRVVATIKTADGPWGVGVRSNVEPALHRK